MVEVSVAKTFTKSASNLAANDRGRVFDFMAKFMENPTSPGLNVERVHDAGSENIWSARVTGDLRAIYNVNGEQCVLLYAGQHDDAYDWASRRRVEHHPVTGTLQIVETTEEAENLLDRPGDSPENKGLFDEHEDDYLLSLGLPTVWLPVIRKVKTDDDLLSIVESLPEEVAERLFRLAEGHLVTPPPPVVPEQPISASPDNLRRFWVVQDAQGLQEVLDKPLVDWVRFLHPSQQELAKGRFNGPAKVTGSAGTGKTVVAMHRAAYLASQNQRVLLTTFVRTLCENIRHNLDLVCTADQLTRITVSTVHSQALRLARDADFDVKPADDQTVHGLIERFRDHYGSSFDKHFLCGEWDALVGNQGVLTWDEYRDARRIGRGRGLHVRQRKQIWSVFQRVLESLREKKLAVWPEIFRRAREALESDQVSSPFDAIIVDEVQDLKPQEIRFLATLSAPNPGNLMLVGDAGQRIYPGGFSLKKLGIDVRGRSRVLRINYRTTEQIRQFADGIMPEAADDLNGGAEARKGTRSLLKGPQPIIRGFKRGADQVAFVVEQIEKLLQQGLQASEIGVFARSKTRYEPLVKTLREKNLPVHELSGDHDQASPAGVNLGTMHRAKGLEFKVVFAYDCAEGIVPHEHTLQKCRDTADYEAARLRDKQLLYVSITRARDEAYISWAGKPSPFLPRDP